MSTALAPDTNPFEGLTIDFNERSLSFKGKTQRLSKVPFDILVKLFNNVGGACSPDFLHESDNAADMNTRSVTPQISNLRKIFRKLLEGHTHQVVIQTEQGKGFVLTADSAKLPYKQLGDKMVVLEGVNLTLRLKEYELLVGLHGNFGVPMSREVLGGYDSEVIDTRAVDTTLSHLNKKINNVGIASIETPCIREQGYMMQWCEGALNMHGQPPKAGEKPHFISNVHHVAEQYLKNVIKSQLRESDFALKCA